MPITVTLGKLNSLTYNTAQCVSDSTSCHLQRDVNSFSVLPVGSYWCFWSTYLLTFAYHRVKAIIDQGGRSCGALCRRRLL